MLNANNLSFAFNGMPLLKNISFRIHKGEVVTLLGASGSGKTTLFNLLTGVLPLQSGSVEMGGVPSPATHTQMSYMMQEELLLPWRTVIRNMTLSAELGEDAHSTQALIGQAKELLGEIGFSDCADMYPDQLSGGMRQRVSLARALLQKRNILLLDEPFGGLDVCTREQMYTLLRHMKNKYGTTMLLVTHDFRDAVSLSDRILLLADGVLTQEWIVEDDLRNHPEYVGRLLEQLRTTMMP